MRILAIGDTDSLAETQRVLARSEFEMYRVPAALAAVRMVRQIPFDLMIVVHPLADTDFAGFYREIRDRSSPCRKSQLLVLSPHSRMGELEEFRQDERLEAVDLQEPQSVSEAAARHLGPVRAAARRDLRLPVSWGAGTGRSHTVDVSAGGALIADESGERPQPGAALDIELGDTGRRLALPCRVVRLTETHEGKKRGFVVSWRSAGDAKLRRLEELLADPERPAFDKMPPSLEDSP